MPTRTRTTSTSSTSTPEDEVIDLTADRRDDDVPTPLEMQESLAEHEAQPASDGGAVSKYAAHVAVEHTARRHAVRISLPLFGSVQLPAPDELAFLGGVGVLAVAGAIEWPVAVAVAAGHALAANHRNKAVEEFGKALEIA